MNDMTNLPTPLTASGKTVLQRLAGLEDATNALISRLPALAPMSRITALESALGLTEEAQP